MHISKNGSTKKKNKKVKLKYSILKKNLQKKINEHIIIFLKKKK